MMVKKTFWFLVGGKKGQAKGQEKISKKLG